MKAYKCDRCHDFFTDNVEIDINTARTTYRNIQIESGKITKERFDLCLDCQMQLKYWLENPCVVLKEEVNHETSN